MPKKWDYDPERVVRNTQDYVGLRNLGCTGYMNCLLQQFFMMPHFRHAVIKAGSLKADELSDEQKKDSLLYQTMRLFSFLSISEKQCMIHEILCKVVKMKLVNPLIHRCNKMYKNF